LTLKWSVNFNFEFASQTRSSHCDFSFHCKIAFSTFSETDVSCDVENLMTFKLVVRNVADKFNFEFSLKTRNLLRFLALLRNRVFNNEKVETFSLLKI